VVVHPAWPQLQVMSGLSDAPSQNALQYLLSGAAMQMQDGWAHFSFLVSAIVANLPRDTSVPGAIVPHRTYKGLLRDYAAR
jgi:hypothetical protein